jgi:uncharacterized protein (TIGR02466 family)
VIEYTPFTTSIWKIENFLTPSIAEVLAHRVKEIQRDDAGVNVSNMGGWQSTARDKPEEFMSTTITELQNKVAEIYNKYAVVKEPQLTNYWFNVNGMHDYNTRHNHPFSFFSAIVYLTTPENSGNIVFTRPDRLWETVMMDELTEYNSGTWWFEPVAGDAYIFPSYLDHHVERNESELERISIALNFI